MHLRLDFICDRIVLFGSIRDLHGVFAFARHSVTGERFWYVCVCANCFRKTMSLVEELLSDRTREIGLLFTVVQGLFALSFLIIRIVMGYYVRYVFVIYSCRCKQVFAHRCGLQTHACFVVHIMI